MEPTPPFLCLRFLLTILSEGFFLAFATKTWVTYYPLEFLLIFLQLGYHLYSPYEFLLLLVLVSHELVLSFHIEHQIWVDPQPPDKKNKELA